MWANPTFDRSPEVRLSVCPVWLTEHERKSNTWSLMCHISLPIICACSNDQNRRRSRTREGRPGTRISDPTLHVAAENKLDREDNNRERARLKRAWDGSDERTDQYVTVALSVHSSMLLTSKLIFTSPLLRLSKNKILADFNLIIILYSWQACLMSQS